MARNILTSQKWCDLIFEGKNREYGAYIMRQTAFQRHVTALLIMTLFAVIVSVILYFVKFEPPVQPEPFDDTIYIDIPKHLKKRAIFTTPEGLAGENEKILELIKEEQASHETVTILISELGDRFVTADNTK